MTGLSLYSVQAVIILDNDGKRIFAKYYSPPYESTSNEDMFSLEGIKTVSEQKSFEKGLFAKTNRQDSDVIIYDNRIVVYKQVVDFVVYIVGGLEENEAMLYQLVVGIRNSLDVILGHSADKRDLLEHYDLLSLVVDQAVDSGIILESDPVILNSRVSRAPQSEASLNNIEFNEQGFLNVYQLAKGKIAESLKQQFQ